MNNEFKAISSLFQQRVPFVHALTTLANGDDASVHQIPGGMELVISTDAAVSGVHWPEDMPLDIAAQRAVNAALSDLAAMGAEASWIWLAIMAKDASCLETMSNGIVRACLDFNIELAGGDTVSSPTNSINVTVAGLLPANTAMKRSAALPGDEIWLVGDLGLSALGLEQWFSGLHQGSCVPAFTTITPLLKKGRQLRELGIKCCMDISDGLMQDAGHIASASQLSLCIEQEKLEQLASYQQLLEATDKNSALQHLLNGGEDYALLFTAPTSSRNQLLKLGAAAIGSCKKGEGVKLMFRGSEAEYSSKGFDHFA